jgi:hypothetical protein
MNLSVLNNWGVKLNNKGFMSWKIAVQCSPLAPTSVANWSKFQTGKGPVKNLSGQKNWLPKFRHIYQKKVRKGLTFF